MSLFDTLTSKIAPYDCLACGAEGQLLCAPCAGKMTPVPERCYGCRELSQGWLICPACRPASRLRSVRIGTTYTGSSKTLIWKLKLSGARAAARIMAQHLVSLTITDDVIIIMPVPTATSRARRRGYDQAKLLARELSRQTRLPYRDYLARRGQTHQHGLTRRERLTQLSAAFRVTNPKAIKGANIMLVDDVVTTGATLEAAAEVLRAAGAARIDAVVFAQP
ncbi:MAG TPA: phosphoribosyltransferase family protein [Candidatus Dormibacteraeota bacterium]|nr:phosphoribosyltransferase family protein [Candidatus Dormibacteraeota bacterium]